MKAFLNLSANLFPLNSLLIHSSPFVLAELAQVKVSQQLAGVLVLHKQPAGTIVDHVSMLFVGTYPPYYKVTLVDGNYVRLVYINAIDGNIIPKWLWPD